MGTARIKTLIFNKRFLQCAVIIELIGVIWLLCLRLGSVAAEGTLETEISVPFVGVTYNMATSNIVSVAANSTVDLQVLQLAATEEDTVQNLAGTRVVGLYVDGGYLCAVTPETVGELQRYFYDKAQEMYAEDSDIVSISFDKVIEFAPLAEDTSTDYIQNTAAVIEKLEANTIAYKSYEIKPTDSVAGIAADLGVAVEDVVNYACKYNDNDVIDWSSKLIVGSKLNVPYEVPYISLQYSKYMEDMEYIPYETKEIYDDTMYDDELSVLTAGEDGVKNLELLVTYKLDGTIANKEIIKSTTVKEAKESVVRVGTVVRVQKAQYTKDTPDGDYVYPVEYADSYISSYMGDGRGHKGLDIAAPYGTPIYAATSGVVSDVGSGWNGGYGNAVVIDNDDGRTCRYAHMSWYVVSEGDTVVKGQIIGYVGNTGNSYGNHLHFEVITSDGNYSNPLNYIYIPQ